MKKIVTLVILIAISNLAIAGVQNTPQVTIYSTTMEARGSMVGAHISADSTQQIYCTTEKWDSGLSHTWCGATDSANNSVVCSTWDSRLVDATLALSDESFILFRWDAIGNCTHIRVENGSRYKE